MSISRTLLVMTNMLKQRSTSPQHVMHLLRLELLEDSSQSSFLQTLRQEKVEIASALRKGKAKAEEEAAKAEDEDEVETPQDVAKEKALANFLNHRHLIQYHDLLDDALQVCRNPRTQTQFASVAE